MSRCLPQNRTPSRRGRSRSRTRRTNNAAGTTVAADMMVLAKQGKFDEIHYRLTRSGADGTFSPCRLGSLLYITNPDDAAFPLHALLKFQPPVTVVDALIRKLQHDCSTLAPGVLVPEEVREKTLHQTALHVAVASHCSLEVIERLLQGESLVMPAMAKDGLHRFPLHWACALPHHKNNGWSLWSRLSSEIDYRWDVVHFLLEQYPVAVVIPDVYNQTPLDYARHNKLHASILELLEHAATEFSKYAPPKRFSSSVREHTEATSLVSEADHVPEELPVLIDPAVGAAAQRQSSWWNGDDVSSLGGDFPSQFSLDSFGASGSATKSPTMAHVTSLFSSALSNLKISPPNSSNTATTTKLPSPPNSANVVTPIQSKRQTTMTPQTSLLGGGAAASEDVSENSSSQKFFEDEGGATATEEEEKTQNSAIVRTKTLLRGNIQVKRSQKKKKQQRAAAGKRIMV